MTDPSTAPIDFEKTVVIKETDDEERTATGIALEPHVVDHQLDFFRPEGIESLYNDDPDTGVMHAVFPDGHAELTRNEIVDEEIELGDETFDAGTWVITRKYHNDELYDLVSEGVLTGFSIGGRVTEEKRYAHDAVPDDLTFPEGVPDDMGATEIIAGTVDEISDVDRPAVPRAEYASVKMAAGRAKANDLAAHKSVFDMAETEAQFVELMHERGTRPSHAERLWAYLDATRNDSATPADDDGDAGKSADTPGLDTTADALDDATVGARLKRLLFGASADSADAGAGASPPVTDEDNWSEETGDDAHRDTPTAPEASDATAKVADASGDTAGIGKVGRTLSERNQRAAMAAHDALEDLLASDVDFESNRFTDNPDVSFDLTEYKSRDASGTDTMTEETTPDDDTVDDAAPAWAKSLTETVEQNADKINELAAAQTEAVEGDGDGESAEKAEETAEGDGDSTEPDEPPAWAKSLTEAVEQNAGQIEEIAKRAGAPTQSETPPAETPADHDGEFDKAWSDTFRLPGGDD